MPPTTVAETVTLRSGLSAALLTAVIVTVPALAVEPAEIVSSVPLCEKSPDAAGATAVEDTVTVTAWLDTALSVAVTVVEPPSSEMDAELSARDTVGVLSSSVIVNVCDDGAVTPLPPATVAETVTSLSGASTSLSAAVMVTVPVLDFEPAAIVRVLSVLRVKSPDTVGDTAVADTVSVRSALDAVVRVAVTVVEPASSSIDDALSTSATVGVSSSSVIVSV